MKRNNKIVPYSVCSWLLPIVFCMQFVVSFCVKNLNELIDRIPSEYEYILLTQLFSIILPCLFVCMYSGAGFKKSFGIKLLKVQKAVQCVLFGFFLQPVAILAGIPLQHFFGAGDSVISPPNGVSELLITTLVVCVVPAFCEELLVRGILLNSIKRKGYVFSVLVTMVIFVILHGNIYSIAGYAVLGVATAFAVLNTNSVFAGILVHLSFNFCGVVLDYAVNRLYTDGGFIGSLNFYIVLGIIGVVMSLIFMGGVYSKKIKKYQTKDFLPNLWEVFVNIPVVITAVLYILYVVF